MKTPRYLFILAFLSLAISGEAQPVADATSGAKEALPSGELIVRQMPASSQWMIDYTYKNSPKPGEDSALVAQYKKLAQQDPAVAREMADPNFIATLAPARILHAEITQTNGVRHEERNLERGLTGELWGSSGFIAERSPMAKKLLVNTVSVNGVNDFPEFFWISQANYTGIETDNGRKCWVFQQQIDPVQLLYHSAGFSGNGRTVEVTAHIDSKTRYPVSLEFGDESRQYTFMPAPAQTLSIPVDFAQAISEFQTRVLKATSGTSAP